MGAYCCREEEPVSVEESEVAITLRSLQWQPLLRESKGGLKVRIRLATSEDKVEFAERLLDQRSLAGAGGDMVVVALFQTFVEDPEMVVLWAEEAEPPHHGLGMAAVTFSATSESFWHSLRVAQAFRHQGIAALLFEACCRLCAEVQGPDGISRWGIVSSNDIMVQWSKRKGLSGPFKLSRYVAPSADVPDRALALPKGWNCRSATLNDRNIILAHTRRKQGEFEVAVPELGALALVKYGSMCRLNERTVDRAILRATVPQKQTFRESGMQLAVPSLDMQMAPLVFNSQGKLAGIALYDTAPNVLDPKVGPLFYWGYVDGTRQGVQVMLDLCRYEAAERGCGAVMGYLPTLPWLSNDMDANMNYKRAAGTHELMYQWRNTDHI